MTSSSGSSTNTIKSSTSTALSNLSSITTVINTGSKNLNDRKIEQIKSTYETGTSESCNSLAWDPHNEHVLLAGVNSKSLKLFDIRNNTKASKSTNTKYVNSFSIDPAANSQQNQAASFFENIVAIWDIRMFDKPVHLITETESILKIQWCPTKVGKIAILPKNSETINVYSIKCINNSLNANVIDDENAPKKIIIDKTRRHLRSIQAMSKASDVKHDLLKKKLSSSSALSTTAEEETEQTTAATTFNSFSNFCFFTNDTKLLVISNANSRYMRTIDLFDTIAIAWSSSGQLCWSSNMFKVNQIENLEKDEYDFIYELNERALVDYGLKYEIFNIVNGNLTSTSNSSNNNLNHISSDTNSNAAMSSPQHHHQQQHQQKLSTFSATPLALALHSVNGFNCLIRSDFLYNSTVCCIKKTTNESGNVKTICSNINYLWKWFEAINLLFESIIPINPKYKLFEKIIFPTRRHFIDLYPIRYCGLRILLEEFIDIKKPPLQYDTIDQDQENFTFISYYLCGWEFKDGSLSKHFFNKLESENQFERAACLAALTGNYEQALETLDIASKLDTRYGCLLFALKYFYDEDQRKQKQQQCNNSGGFKKQYQSKSSTQTPVATNNTPNILFSESAFLLNLQSPFSAQNRSASVFFNNETPLSSNANESPNTINEANKQAEFIAIKEYLELVDTFQNSYLKAMFNYLINKENAIQKILFDKDILFQDRIALSVYFKFKSNDPCHDLVKYFDKIVNEECIENADLHGILLTGLSEKSIKLFQSFVDRTNDIQTVALAIIHTPYIEVLESKQVNYWINCFRELLNKYKLWEKRAEYDVFKMKLLKVQNYVNSTNLQKQTAETTENNTISSIQSDTTANISSSSTSSLRSNTNNLQNKFYINTISPPAPLSQVKQQTLNKMLVVTNNNETHQQKRLKQKQQIAIYLICNNCKKNIYNKVNLMTNQNKEMTTSMSNSSSIMIKKCNDQSLNGCLNCSHYLPQVGLKYGGYII